MERCGKRHKFRFKPEIPWTSVEIWGNINKEFQIVSKLIILLALKQIFTCEISFLPLLKQIRSLYCLEFGCEVSRQGNKQLHQRFLDNFSLQGGKEHCCTLGAAGPTLLHQGFTTQENKRWHFLQAVCIVEIRRDLSHKLQCINRCFYECNFLPESKTVLTFR